jgi:hypothetical protein
MNGIKECVEVGIQPWYEQGKNEEVGIAKLILSPKCFRHFLSSGVRAEIPHNLSGTKKTHPPAATVRVLADRLKVFHILT